MTSMAVTHGGVLEVVTDLLVKLGVEAELITSAAVLGRDLELDSTDAVEVALELKRHFGVTVKVQVKGDETVEDLVELVLAEAARTEAG